MQLPDKVQAYSLQQGELWEGRGNIAAVVSRVNRIAARKMIRG